MPFKYDSSGNLVTQGEGDRKLPVFVHPDGREAPLDGEQTLGTISRLNGEAKAHRERAEAAETAYKPFKEAGLIDAEEARRAVETMRNIKDGDLIAAGKVEEIKLAAKKAAEEQVAAASKAHAEKLAQTAAERDKLTAELNAHIVGGGFARSKLITDEKHPLRLAIPADMAEAYFGRHYKVENGRAVGYDAAGNKIFSTARPGEVADFDEALQYLVERYPNKEFILRGSGASGGGAQGGGGSKGAGGKTQLTRTEFAALSPADQAAKGRDPNIQIVD